MGCSTLSGFSSILVNMFCRLKRKSSDARRGGGRGEKPMPDISKLVFFGSCSFDFKLNDLLKPANADSKLKDFLKRANAEVLETGTGYILKEGSTATVFMKSLKMGKEDFERQMERIERVGRHPNVVPLRAYYYSQNEQLLVYDYYRPWGSLMYPLHGEVGTRDGQITLNWEAKLKIALGAARGIAHLHSMGFTHGNIKSSNVLINQDKDGCISDFGIPHHAAGGYQAPEVVRTRKNSRESDVYSFGVLLLEMLTGRPQNQSPEARDPDIEEEMTRALRIGLSCVEQVPRYRPTIHHVVEKLHDIRTYRPSD